MCLHDCFHTQPFPARLRAQRPLVAHQEKTSKLLHWGLENDKQSQSKRRVLDSQPYDSSWSDYWYKRKHMILAKRWTAKGMMKKTIINQLERMNERSKVERGVERLR